MTATGSSPIGGPAATYAYIGALVDELARGGVRHACICPGSRSTPLAILIARDERIKTWMHVDERSASYFALGLAASSETPVALVCTSGTAAANFLPAIVEARYGRLPLVALTADRPPELRDVGAPQAIDQVHLYGGHAKWFVDLALPETSESALRYVRATAARAVSTALDGPAGPVHVNVPLREPLTPPEDGWPDAAYGRADSRPYTASPRSDHDRQFAPEELMALAEELFATPRGLIVCGPRPGHGLAKGLLRLAYALDWPILADPLSGLRCGPEHDRHYILDAYDAFLRDERAAALRPDVVLRFGAPPTSKALHTFLSWAGRQVMVDPDGGWRDPGARADTILRANPRLFVERLAGHVGHGTAGSDERRRWHAAWRDADMRARQALDRFVAGLEEPFEGRVFAELAMLLPDGATLFAGNSMPVRDLDAFYPGSSRDVRFLANRGANGIDGVVSSALGAAACGRGPLVLAIGDLSFYHDLNGLLAARRHNLNATIVLLNNNGGGIFSFLPQAGLPEYFELLFGTPTGLDYGPAVEMYGCSFQRARSWPAFRTALSAGLGAPGVDVIELRTERARNVELHRRAWAAVAEALWRA